MPEVPFGIDMSNCEIKDKDLELLTRFKYLALVNLYSTAISGEGIISLSKLGILSELNLNSIDFEPKYSTCISKLDGLTSLRSISELKKLQSLDISNTQISNEGLIALSKMHSLQKLWLSGNRSLSDNCLVHLTELAQLSELHLNYTSITGVGLSSLKATRTLACLNFWGTELDDHSIQAITRFENLHTLYLSETGITDNGVKLISKLTKLTTLKLYKTNVNGSCFKHFSNAKIQALSLTNTKLDDTVDQLYFCY
jgi:hypothetical protein